MPIPFIPEEKESAPNVGRFRLWLRVAFFDLTVLLYTEAILQNISFFFFSCAPGIHQKMPNCDGRTLGLLKDSLHESSVSESTSHLNINVIQQHSNQRAKGQKTHKNMFLCVQGHVLL